MHLPPILLQGRPKSHRPGLVSHLGAEGTGRRANWVVSAVKRKAQIPISDPRMGKGLPINIGRWSPALNVRPKGLPLARQKERNETVAAQGERYVEQQSDPKRARTGTRAQE